MAIDPNNGVLDIINGVLKVTSIDIKQAGGFTTAINTVARNDVLLFDDQKATTTFLPTEGSDYRSSTGFTRDTTALDFNDGWVYWPLQLPNSWHAEFDMLIASTGGVFTFSLFNTSTPNHTDYTANDGGYKIVFDNTLNKISIYFEGSVHTLVNANVRSADWQRVVINYFQGAISISLAGEVVLHYEFTENYQEFDSRYVGFSATSGTSHKIRNLKVHNSDKWLYTNTANASHISYMSGNVGVGTLEPSEKLDVYGNVHISEDLTVDGNLVITGTTFSVDQTNLSIEDPIIELARGNTSDTIDSGIIMTRGGSNVAMTYMGDESELVLAYTQSGATDSEITPDADGGLDVRVYGNLFANNLTTTANVEAVYLKGDGSELTQITLDQVVGYSNITANTIQLTNSDVGLKLTGNVEANYFVGDGSRLDNISATLQEITDNSNTTSNTVQFTNDTTAFIADSNVGIGTSLPAANLHVVGYQYVNDPPTVSASFDHTDAPLTLTHLTPTSDTAIDDPKPVLHLTREGTQGTNYGARASLKMSRYEHDSTASRSRLDVTLADGTYSETSVMTVRSDGRVGINTTAPIQQLDVVGNVHVSNNITTNSLTLNNVSVTTTFGLDEILNESNTTTNTIQITNTSGTALDVTGGASVGSNLQVGTANLFVDTTTGRVGVGTGSPQETLDVRGAIVAPVVSWSSSQDAPYLIAATTNYDGTSTNWGTYGFHHRIKSDSGGLPRVTIDTPQSGETFCITNQGKVGIGVSSPITKFHVVDANPEITLKNTGGSSNQTSGMRFYGTFANYTDTGTRRAADIQAGFRNGSSQGTWGYQYMSFHVGKGSTANDSQSLNDERMCITGTGNVGIGTDSPQEKLHVYTDSASSGSQLFIRNANASNRAGLSLINSDNSYFNIQHVSGNSNVGIIENFSQTNGGIAFYAKGDGKYTFRTTDSNSLRMVIDNDGNVGIGITNPTVALDVNGVISASGSTSGANHGTSSILYLLDTSFYKEWSYTGAVTPVVKITFNSSTEIPSNAKAVLAEVYLSRDTRTGGDHQIHCLGKDHTANQTSWVGGYSTSAPSTTFGNNVDTRQVANLLMPGDSDGFTHHYGKWYSSVIIPLENNKVYYSNYGNSNSNGWVYVQVRGYFL